jgi:hypothetical protein
MPAIFSSCLRCGDACDGGGPCLACAEVVVSATHGVVTTTMTAYEDAAEKDRARMAADGETTSRVLRYVPAVEADGAPVDVGSTMAFLEGGAWFGCLTFHYNDIRIEDMNPANRLPDGCSALRQMGTYEQAKAAAAERGGNVVRILPDGAHEAAIAAAREEGRISGLAALRERMVDEGDVLAWGSAGEGLSDYESGISWALGLLDKALKGPAS